MMRTLALPALLLTIAISAGWAAGCADGGSAPSGVDHDAGELGADSDHINDTSDTHSGQPDAVSDGGGAGGDAVSDANSDDTTAGDTGPDDAEQNGEDVAPSPDAAHRDVRDDVRAVDSGPRDPDADTDGTADIDADAPTCTLPAAASPLRINEVITRNEGLWIDEEGDTEDLIELRNMTDAPVSLLGWSVADAADEPWRLGDLTVPAAGVLLLVADDDPSEGTAHLPFRLSSAGDRVVLRDADGVVVHQLDVPPLREDEAYGLFGDDAACLERCIYASPGRANGARCGPPPVEPPRSDDAFLPYEWPAPWPPRPGPIAIERLALRGAAEIEVANTEIDAVELAEYQLVGAALEPHQRWPSAAREHVIAWPTTPAILEPGMSVVVEVPSALREAFAATDNYEGVVEIRRRDDDSVVSQVDFTAWPDGATLERHPGHTGYRFCARADSGACEPMTSRPLPSYARNLYTPGDFDALQGSFGSLQAIKFTLDGANSDFVYFLNFCRWQEHADFEERELCPPDAPGDGGLACRGDPSRFVRGALRRNTWNEAHVIQLNPTLVNAARLRARFFDVAARLARPSRWSLSPMSRAQSDALRTIEGTLPIMPQEAFFEGVTFQPLTPGLAMGRLQVVATSELEGSTALGPQHIVITAAVPSDMPLIGGLITETQQTALSHANLLSQARGTPNMSLREARTDERIAPHIGSLVRFSVTTDGFELASASAEEVADFHAARGGRESRRLPLDTSRVGLVDLQDAGIDAVDSIGAKAAQLAELARVVSAEPRCPGPVPTPERPAAVPVSHYLDHLDASGAADLLERAHDDANFLADPDTRATALAEIRAAIASHPVDAALVEEIGEWLAANYSGERVRFRSSSNAEDLGDFNGAGLYDSVTVDPDDGSAGIETGLHLVWSSLWTQRAWDERQFAGIEQLSAAMAVLIHPSFRSEEASAVALSRVLFYPELPETSFFSVQAGEASVVSPPPGVSTDQVAYDWNGQTTNYISRSSLLPPGETAMTDAEIGLAACYLRVADRHFRPLIDPDGSDALFTSELELKLEDRTRRIVVKQYRPVPLREAGSGDRCR